MPIAYDLGMQGQDRKEIPGMRQEMRLEEERMHGMIMFIDSHKCVLRWYLHTSTPIR